VQHAPVEEDTVVRAAATAVDVGVVVVCWREGAVDEEEEGEEESAAGGGGGGGGVAHAHAPSKGWHGGLGVAARGGRDGGLVTGKGGKGKCV
jgi:hypothetical protein